MHIFGTVPLRKGAHTTAFYPLIGSTRKPPRVRNKSNTDRYCLTPEMPARCVLIPVSEITVVIAFFLRRFLALMHIIQATE